MSQTSIFDLLDPPAPLPAPALLPAAPPSPLADRVPIRIQRGCKRGWKRPPCSASIGRGTLFANPFPSTRFGHARSILAYERWLEGRLSDLALERMGYCPAEAAALWRLRQRVLANLWRIHRQDLVCSCPLTSRWCHGHSLIRAANDDLSPQALFHAQQAHVEAWLAARERSKRGVR